MRPALALALAGLLLAAGCSGSTGDETSATSASSAGASPGASGRGSSPTGSSTSGGSASPATTADSGEGSTAAPGSCPVGEDAVALFSRDWERVAGAVGRPDIAKYTKPLVTEVDSLAKQAASCAGAERLPRLAATIRSIDEGATSGGVDLDDVATFRREGNAWLEALGYGPDRLPTG